MSRQVLPSSIAMAMVGWVAACGSSDVTGLGSGGSGGSSGPLIVQPQPIPDDGFAARLDGKSFTVAASSDGLTVAGLASTGAPGQPRGGASVSALDLTTVSAVVTATADASGAFSLDLVGGTAGDRVLVFFPGDPLLETAFEVPTSTPAAATSPCVLADGLNGLDLGKTPAGVTAEIDVTFSSSCGAPLTVDGIRIAGDQVVTAPAPGFTVPVSGMSASEAFLVTPTRAASYVAFVILASGAERHVFTLTGTAD